MDVSLEGKVSYYIDTVHMSHTAPVKIKFLNVYYKMLFQIDWDSH